MSKRSDVLRIPEGFDELAAERWRMIAPILWKNGLLTTDTRDDVEWMCRLHSRCFGDVRRQRRASGQPDVGDQEGLASLRELKLLLRLEYRYGVNAPGRMEMADRGYPGTLNPADADMLEADEAELCLP